MLPCSRKESCFRKPWFLVTSRAFSLKVHSQISQPREVTMRSVRSALLLVCLLVLSVPISSAQTLQPPLPPVNMSFAATPKAVERPLHIGANEAGRSRAVAPTDQSVFLQLSAGLSLVSLPVWTPSQ